MSEAAGREKSTVDRRRHNAARTTDGLFKVFFVARRNRRKTYVDWADPSVAGRLVDDPEATAIALGQLLDLRRGLDGQGVGYLALDTEASTFVDVRIREGHERDLEADERDRSVETILDLANEGGPS
jgi:hypothetical protein